MTSKQQFIRDYQEIRSKTEALCEPLAIEDYVIQSIEDVSPPKWHLAHTTWFFETFILIAKLPSYRVFNPLFHHLFNSYYQSIGHPYPRMRRGLLSRPTVSTVYAYRQYVNENLIDYVGQIPESEFQILKSILILGLHHEQQHQELLLMDIKHNFSLDPNFPTYHPFLKKNSFETKASELTYVEGGIVEIGHQGMEFCFDNELPRHQLILHPFKIATGLVINAEYSEFIAASGYKKADWWLSDGWEYVQKNQWQAPLYWQKLENKWHIFTLSGLCELDPAEPVSHISYYEADAYARWRGLRLPSEAEWEHYAASIKVGSSQDNFLESNIFHPRSLVEENKAGGQQLFGDLWEWTASPYCPYPGFKPLRGALGEYNGKFMSNQMVLRGGSCVTPKSHIRPSYRNFFQPDKRWQFSGIRLASDV